MHGNVLATYILRKEKYNTLEWTKRVIQTLRIEVISLLTLLVATYFSHNSSSLNTALIFLAAFSMGIQYSYATQVNRTVVTTMVTGPLRDLLQAL